MLWGSTTAQWRMTEEGLQRQWLYQVKVEPSHPGIHTFPLFSVNTSVVKPLHIKGLKSANIISHATHNGVMHAVALLAPSSAPLCKLYM